MDDEDGQTAGPGRKISIHHLDKTRLVRVVKICAPDQVNTETRVRPLVAKGSKYTRETLGKQLSHLTAQNMIYSHKLSS